MVWSEACSLGQVQERDFTAGQVSPRRSLFSGSFLGVLFPATQPWHLMLTRTAVHARMWVKVCSALGRASGAQVGTGGDMVKIGHRRAC